MNAIMAHNKTKGKKDQITNGHKQRENE